MGLGYLAELEAAKTRVEWYAKMEKLIQRSASLVAEKGPMTKGELRKLLEVKG